MTEILVAQYIEGINTTNTIYVNKINSCPADSHEGWLRDLISDNIIRTPGVYIVSFYKPGSLNAKIFRVSEIKNPSFVISPYRESS